MKNILAIYALILGLAIATPIMLKATDSMSQTVEKPADAKAKSDIKYTRQEAIKKTKARLTKLEAMTDEQWQEKQEQRKKNRKKAKEGKKAGKLSDEERMKIKEQFNQQ